MSITADNNRVTTAEQQKAAENVWILDDSFYIPQLHRSRRIWLYLPEDYATSGLEYPVLYMQDGQNLFEEWAAFGEEWEVDETLNAIKGKCIVVGIENGGAKRLNEYSLEDNPRYGNGEGRAYLAFLAETLKPYIDKNFRTKTAREHTYVAGSSMGALISLYACLYHPHVFGGGGMLSPAFWIAPELVHEIESNMERNLQPQRLYFYYGGQECSEMEEFTEPVISSLRKFGNLSVEKVVNATGTHVEAEWRREFLSFYRWMMDEQVPQKRRSKKGSL